MEEIAKALPYGFGIAWNGISFQEQQAGSQTGALYTLSILIVFLCLAALYESWSIPIAVILVVPLGVIGALGMTGAFGMNNDVYFQVGLLTTIGLVSKNAILIVEFAKELHEKGESIVHAAAHAVRMRIRPIMMTSLAFGLGVLPLAKEPRRIRCTERHRYRCVRRYADRYFPLYLLRSAVLCAHC